MCRCVWPTLPMGRCVGGMSIFLMAGWLVVCCGGVRSTALAQGFATTVQLPTFGVSVDPQGVLTLKSVQDPTGALRRQRFQAAEAALPKDVAAKSRLRKISLTRLEKAIARRLAVGKPLEESMQCLAGLQRIQYVFCYPEAQELIIAGPAEGWMPDLVGRPVGVTTGKPVILLEDLVVALRTYAPGKRPIQQLGCSIEPTQEGLRRLQTFQQTIPKTVRQQQRAALAAHVERGLREALGLARIRVFGISPKTHFAQVLIEADYRMKLIAMGLEPGGVIKSYVELLPPGGVAMGTLQRWWFVPDYQCVKTTEDRLGLELLGQGVQLLTEDKLIARQGDLGPGRRANTASRLFAQGFSKKYPQLSAIKPIYAQMRNLFDLAVVAAHIQKQDFCGRIGWNLGVFGDEQTFAVETYQDAQQAPAAIRVFWKGNRLIAPAGGGVDARPQLTLEGDNLVSGKDTQVGKQQAALWKDVPRDRWWWD